MLTTINAEKFSSAVVTSDLGKDIKGTIPGFEF